MSQRQGRSSEKIGSNRKMQMWKHKETRCALPAFVTANLLRYKCGRGVTGPQIGRCTMPLMARTRWELGSPISVEWEKLLCWST